MAGYDETRLSVTTVTNAAGLKLQVYGWKAYEEAKAAILMVHGIGGHARMDFLRHPQCDEAEKLGKDYVAKKEDYRLVYEGSWVQSLNLAGFDAYAYDLQGHGESDSWQGVRANVESFNDFIDDTIEVLRHLASCTDRRIFMCGISLGGCIVARTCAQGLKRGSLISVADRNRENTSSDEKGVCIGGAILLAPALSLDKLKKKAVNRMLIPVSGIVSQLAPHAKLCQKETNREFPYLESLVDFDPLTHKGDKFPARISREILCAVDEAQTEAKLIKDVPFLVIHSVHDTMCEPDGSRAFFEGMTENDRKELVMLDTMWHFLTKEPGSGKVLQRITEWMNGVAADKVLPDC